MERQQPQEVEELKDQGRRQQAQVDRCCVQECSEGFCVDGDVMRTGVSV